MLNQAIIEEKGGERKLYKEIRFPLPPDKSLVALVHEATYAYCVEADQNLFNKSENISDKAVEFPRIEWFLIFTNNIRQLPLKRLFPSQ
jgi:hypothetical protein